MQVTTWYRYTLDEYDGHYEYNHLEDGWQDSDAPNAVSKLQEKAWTGKQWMKKHCQLIDGKVVEPND